MATGHAMLINLHLNRLKTIIIIIFFNNNNLFAYIQLHRKKNTRKIEKFTVK
jgi:hypothetical protein